MSVVADRPLTLKQAAFIEAYARTRNATQAAREAGYKGNDVTLGAVAAENLQKPQIAKKVSRLINQAMARAGKSSIDVFQEFEDQLAFAKKLRKAAEEYLSDPDDPLKMQIIPRAEEIDVVYLDHTDRTDTDPPRPKRKTAKLAYLLADVAEVRNIEVDKVNIKHYDLRKFALDSINTTDTCIDKFAKLMGAYQENKIPMEFVQVIQMLLARIFDAQDVERFNKELKGVLENPKRLKA